MVDQALPATAGSRAQQRVLESQQRQPRGMEGRRDGPPHDLPGADVGDERDVTEACQDPDIGDVSDPELIRALGAELAFHQVRAGIRLPSRLCRDGLAATPNPLEAGFPHESGDLVPTDLPPSAAHRVVHLPYAVDAVVLGMDPLELLQEQDVSQGPR